jgi:hypothetical protein
VVRDARYDYPYGPRHAKHGSTTPQGRQINGKCPYLVRILAVALCPTAGR